MGAGLNARQGKKGSHMPKHDYDLIVIGGGAAGLTASTFAGQAGAKTLLIEREPKLGGDCLHYGCVPSKSLIKSASAYHIIRHSEKYGLPKADIAPVDFSAVARRIQDIIGVIQRRDDPPYLAQHYNVETQFGEAKFLDRHTILLNGKRLTARYFVIATGSSAAVPAVEGLANVPYLTNTSVFSLSKLPGRLLVLGGGPIGMEMAQAFVRLGSKVTVIQHSPTILAREDEDVSRYVEDFLKEEGIVIRTNTKPVKVVQSEGTVLLTVENKGQTLILEGDALLVAAGRQPNVGGLDLEKAGVAYTPRGIQVDKKMRTTAKHIYACGDVTGSYQFTHVASYEAVVAIYNAILKIPKNADYRSVPWCTYLDPEVASIGYNEKRAKEAGIDPRIQVEYFRDNDRALAESETKGFIKIVMGPKGKVIGVQIIGPHAGDLIAEWIPILNGQRRLSPVADAIHPYPTLSEINKSASVKYQVAGIPPWTKKLTQWLFGYQGKVD